MFLGLSTRLQTTWHAELWKSKVRLSSGKAIVLRKFPLPNWLISMLTLMMKLS